MTPASSRTPERARFRSAARALAAFAALSAFAIHPALAQQNRCQQLEGQLASLDRMGGGGSDQVRRFEDAANRQQVELDRTIAQSRQLGCESRGFFLFAGPQPEQCGPLTRRIQEQRANLDQVQSELARLQGSGVNAERENQRRALLAALNQSDCGPQYRQAAQQPARGLFEALFGSGPAGGGGPGSGDMTPVPDTGGQSGTFRTVCVRTCDGYFYPISFATSPARFGEDERVCQRSCPAAEVSLYSYPNPGGDIKQATSTTGQPYTALPNAFRYRQSFDAACSCKRQGETWAQTMKGVEDQTVERGDIVVNEQRARQMSQPRVDAQGRPIRQDSRPGQRPAPAVPGTPAAEAPAQPDPNRNVRNVGPAFYSTR